MHYEKIEKAVAAAEMFSFFKRLFPGSVFYWVARFKEIKNAYIVCREFSRESSQTELVIELCKQYCIDVNIVSSPAYIEVVHVIGNMF